MQPKVIICCSTYNQEKYIEQALQGLVMQKTNFPFVVHVHDDCSTDDTKNIILKYQKLYPEIIIPKFHDFNYFSRDCGMLTEKLHSDITSEYFGLCDGDDYWTDEQKLQKQVDFLDNNPDFSICFNPVEVKYEDDESKNSLYPEPEFYKNKTEFTLEDLLEQNFIATSSVLYRWRKDFNEVFPFGIFPGDWFKHLLHAEKGKIKIIPEVMGIYRKYAGSVWSGAGENDSFYLKNGIKFINFYQTAAKRWNHDYSPQIKWEMKRILLAFLSSGQYDQVSRLAELDKGIFDSIIDDLRNIDNLYNGYCESKERQHKIIDDMLKLEVNHSEGMRKLEREIAKKRKKTVQIRYLLALSFSLVCFIFYLYFAK